VQLRIHQRVRLHRNSMVLAILAMFDSILMHHDLVSPRRVILVALGTFDELAYAYACHIGSIQPI
jgi:hypothetical protein